MKLNKSSKTLVLKVTSDYFKTKGNPILVKAAKKVMKTINSHFKKDGWELRTDYLIDEVFYEAYGEHLSNYLYKELFFNSKKGYYITTSKKHGDLVIKKNKNV